MKATGVRLDIKLPLGSGTTSLEWARRLIAALPPCDGVATGPRFEEDRMHLMPEESDAFRHTQAMIFLGNPSVLENQSWSATLSHVDMGEAGTSISLSSILGGPGFPRIWAYLRRAAPVVADALRPRFATMAGFGAPANRLEDLVGREVPRTFGPWTYIGLDGARPDTVTGLESLPDCTLVRLSHGLAVEAVQDPSAKPSDRFLAALGRIPSLPPPVYLRTTFPPLK